MADPTIGPFTPADGSEIRRFGTVSFNVTDDGLEHVVISAKFPAGREWETVHDGADFSPQYSAGSTRLPISGGYSYVLKRAEGWPSSPTIYVRAYDTPDNNVEITLTQSGSLEDEDSVVVEVTDPDELQPVTLVAKWPDRWETVYDGVQFAPMYRGSEREDITDGYRFTVRRTGGWDEGFTLEAIAFGVFLDATVYPDVIDSTLVVYSPTVSRYDPYTDILHAYDAPSPLYQDLTLAGHPWRYHSVTDAVGGTVALGTGPTAGSDPFDGTFRAASGGVEYLQATGVPAIAQPYTVALVFSRLTGQTGGMVAVDSRSGASVTSIEWTSAGTIRVSAGATSFTAPLAHDFGVLHYVLAVFNGASSALYVDAHVTATATGTLATTSFTPIRIGTNNSNGSGWWGTIPAVYVLQGTLNSVSKRAAVANLLGF